MVHSLQSAQGKRLQSVLVELDITPYQFSKDLSYKSPDTIYHIINGVNGISNSFLERVEKSEYPINIEWLLTGFGTSIKHDMRYEGGNGSELNTGVKIIYPSELDFYFLKKLTQEFANVIGVEDKSYSVSIRITLLKGLEFLFETFDIYSREEVRCSKIYALILQADWKVSTYFDFWRVEEPSIRCQNLLELYKEVSQEFENAIFRVYSDLKRLIHNEEIAYIPEKFLKDNESFVELYQTDSRIKQIHR